MLIENQHPNNKSIMAAVLGVPNSGKSTLVNTLIGMDLSVVTHKPQTTRNKFHCVFTVDRTEVILVDTPGLHKSQKEFNKRLNEQAREGVDGADVNLLLVDLTRDVFPQLQEMNETLERELGPSLMVFTKSDLIKDYDKLPLEEVFAKAKELLPSLEKYFVISALKEDNIHKLLGELCDRAQSGPHHYTEGEVSNKNERFFVTEYIREQAFLLLKEELPYEMAVLIDEYKDLKEEDNSKIVSHISASIIVNRPSQRAIVVGSQGSMIKAIGTGARKKIELMVGGQVHLNLHVKVIPNWFKNNMILEELGLPRAHDSYRVWRKKEA